MMISTKILIVEDEVLIADFIFELLERENFKNVAVAYSKKEATDLMDQFNPDIILMDINLNGVNAGIDLAKQAKDKAVVIFLTGQYDFELTNKALETNPDSYLTKPIKETDLLAAIQLAILKNQLKSIVVKDSLHTIRIKFDDILYVQSDGNYIDINTISKVHSVRMSLDGFLQEVNNLDFIRVHKSYIINKLKVTKLSNNVAYIGTTEIPISRNFTLKL